MLAALLIAAQSIVSPKIDVDPSKALHTVPRSLYGIFFEEINRAGEGGIFAELLNNRSLEIPNPNQPIPGWISKSGVMSVDASTPFNSTHPHSIKFKGTLNNPGFWGIHIKSNKQYQLTIWLKGTGQVTAKLGNQTQSVGTLTNTWKQYNLTFKPAANTKAELDLTTTGEAWLGFASLMPSDAWGKSKLRADLAGKIVDLKPGFIRFPGGCFIEGQTLARAWDWKTTLGSPETRKGHTASFWGYPTSNGLGYHEYLQWCEDSGADALFVANCGMSHSEVAPLSEMSKYVQDALDAIEYATGDITTTYGALRAKNGHPQPFKLKYVQIGNENGGPAYNERYKLLAEAIKNKHPEITTIACLWGGLPTSYPIEIIDEHYYNDPSFFWANINRYDNYDRNGPKIYVGEYAVTRNSGLGNLDAALSEAAFITGMERNADIVKMSSYAPLLSNISDKQWNPNAIVFNNHQAYGTPSYWVQQMFAQNRPDQTVKITTQLPAPKTGFSGSISLMTWETQAEFRNINLNVDGKAVKPNGWTPNGGNWNFGTDLITQSQGGTNRVATAQGVNLKGHKKIHLSLEAKKNAGNEGFIIVLGADAPGSVQWNLGGWQNTQHAFQIMGGGPQPGAVNAKIETNRWYKIDLIVENNKIRGLLDNVKIQEIDLPSIPNFAATAGKLKNGTLILKMVNGAETTASIPLSIAGFKSNLQADITTLTGPSLAAENTFAQPTLIAPKKSKTTLKNGQPYSVPPRSFVILRIPK